MNQRLAVLLATAATALAVPLAATVAQEGAKTDAAAKTEAEAKIPEGQKIFLDSGCNACHSMKAQGIEKKKSSTATAAASPTSTSKIPDLSAAGLEHDQAWITKFLQKTETLKGKKHMKSWKGTEDDLKKLTAWLAEQKNAEAAGLKASGDKAMQEAKEAKQEAKEAKQEAQEAKKDANEALDQAKEAKEDAQKAQEDAQKAKEQSGSK